MNYLLIPLACLLFVSVYSIDHINQAKHQKLIDCVNTTEQTDSDCDSCYYVAYGYYPD